VIERSHETHFLSGDEYERTGILSDLASAAIYQPDQVIGLVRLAIDRPIAVDQTGDTSQFRLGQKHVLSALPPLLEATAYHPDKRRGSVTTLWELTKTTSDSGSAFESAKTILERLSAWHRYGDPSHNFSILIEAIRFTRRTDGLTGDFTPFELIDEIWEREGEFNEWQDETTMSVGALA
jgi:hypothetical protein